jgi:hypothetical protein
MTEVLPKKEGRASGNTVIPEPSSESIPDNAARIEAAQVASGDYDENESARSDQLRHHVHLAMLAGIWLMFGLIAISVLAVAWHYLVPERYEWLSEPQLTALKTFIFSGAVTGAGNRYFSSRLSAPSR